MKSKQIERRSAGLANIGNTCYMNSAIQCFSACLELANYITSGKYLTDVDDHNKRRVVWPFFVHFGNLLVYIWKDDSTITPKTFHAVFGQYYSRFRGRNQHDAHECMTFILDGIHAALKYEVDVSITRQKQDKELSERERMELESLEQWSRHFKDQYSKIIDLFYGQLHSVQKCLTCGSISHIYEPMMQLQLPIPEEHRPGKLSLYDCMKAYVSENDLVGNNKYLCESKTCNGTKQDGKKYLKIWKPPKILFVQLKRFDSSGKKIEAFINVPLSGFDIVPYISEFKISPKHYNKIRNSENNKYIYDLFAVCNHSGNSNGGHYTATTLNPNGNWYNYNDSVVNHVTEDDVISEKSYIFLFRNRRLSDVKLQSAQPKKNKRNA